MTLRLIFIIGLLLGADTSLRVSSSPADNGQQSVSLNDRCKEIKREWVTLHYTSVNGALPPVQVESSLVCRTAESCCSPGMEGEMRSLAQFQLSRTLTEWLSGPMISMGNDSVALFGYFKEDLETSRTRLHQLLSSTYGAYYNQNREYIFTFLQDLEVYVRGGEKSSSQAPTSLQTPNLANLVENFLDGLLTRVTRTIMQSDGGTGSKAEEARVVCAVGQVKLRSDYRQVAEGIKQTLTPSYVAARFLVNGLALGREALANLLAKARLTTECNRAAMGLRYCHLCAGVLTRPTSGEGSGVAPCRGFCTNVFNGCLIDYSHLADVWSRFVDLLVQVGARLEREENSPNPTSQLHLQISEAIKTLQRLYEESRSQVEAQCGRGGSSPAQQQGRRRRRRSETADPELYKWQARSQNKQSADHQQSDGSDSGGVGGQQQLGTDRAAAFAARLKGKYNMYRDQFKEVGSYICSLPSLHWSLPNQSDTCWNGTHVGKYTRTVVDGRPDSQAGNPMFQLDTRLTNPVVQRELGRLRQMAERLKKVLKGGEPLLVPLDDPQRREVRTLTNTGDNIGVEGSGSERLAPAFDNLPPTVKTGSDLLPTDPVLPFPPQQLSPLPSQSGSLPSGEGSGEFEIAEGVPPRPPGVPLDLESGATSKPSAQQKQTGSSTPVTTVAAVAAPRAGKLPDRGTGTGVQPNPDDEDVAGSPKFPPEGSGELPTATLAPGAPPLPSAPPDLGSGFPPLPSDNKPPSPDEHKRSSEAARKIPTTTGSQIGSDLRGILEMTKLPTHTPVPDEPSREVIYPARQPSLAPKLSWSRGSVLPTVFIVVLVEMFFRLR